MKPAIAPDIFGPNLRAAILKPLPPIPPISPGFEKFEKQMLGTLAFAERLTQPHSQKDKK